jgi:serine/threonine protein kinase
MPLLFGFNQKKKPVANRKIDKVFAISGLPNNGSLTLSPETQEIPDTTDLKCGLELGKGAFGTVHLCTQAGEDGEKFALKTIDLDHLQDAAAQHAFMRLVKREVSALKKLGMLKGFKREGNKIYILMPFVEGKTFGKKFTEEDDLRESAKLVKKGLQALRDLHDQGIAHMDSHVSNMIVGDNGEVTLIDFGLSVEIDDNVFFMQDEARITQCSRLLRLVMNKDSNSILEKMFLTKLDQALWRLYIEETLHYIGEHKMETALKVLTYGVVSIAAMHGLATYQVARIMAWSLTRMLAHEYLAKQLFMNLKIFEAGRGFADQDVNMGGLNVNIGQINRILGNIFSRILPVVILAHISKNIYDNKESVYLLYNITTAALTGNPRAAYEIVKKIDIEQAFNMALLYSPINRIPRFLANAAEEHLTSVESLGETCKKIAFGP